MIEDLKPKKDERGMFLEVIKIPGKGQVNYSISYPGVLRGNHYHARKFEKFFVLEGEGKVKMRNRETQEIKEIEISEEKFQLVDIPANWTHNIRNTGKKNMLLLIWVNEIFNPEDPDTFFEEV